MGEFFPDHRQTRDSFYLKLLIEKFLHSAFRYSSGNIVLLEAALSYFQASTATAKIISFYMFVLQFPIHSKYLTPFHSLS